VRSEAAALTNPSGVAVASIFKNSSEVERNEDELQELQPCKGNELLAPGVVHEVPVPVHAKVGEQKLGGGSSPEDST